HPLIRQRAKAELAACAALSPPYALLAVPLLLETGGKTVYGLDRILLVDCPETLQVARVMARSALTKAEAEAILAAQTDRATRRAAADDILDNSGSPEALPAAVAHLHALYLQRIPKQESA
ncbi:MAG: dephospho-CoA kinase, partial [Zoogloeaceae bacterium]|nr:dephospho-CoA kinase [Zoogloeaceae bacterium]